MIPIKLAFYLRVLHESQFGSCIVCLEDTVFELIRKIVICHSLDESSFCVLNFIYGFLFALTIFHVFSLVFLSTNAYPHLAFSISKMVFVSVVRRKV